MRTHFHVSIDHVVFITVASIVGWNVVRLGAAQMVKYGKDDGLLNRAGQALGALVS